MVVPASALLIARQLQPHLEGLQLYAGFTSKEVRLHLQPLACVLHARM